MKKLLYPLFLLLFWQTVGAQQTIDLGKNYYEDREGVIYERELTVDLKLHTNGFAFGVNIANLKTYYLTNFVNIEFGNVKHPKQFRNNSDGFQVANTGQVARSFVFGKQNNFFTLRGGLGQKRYFSEKAKRKGVAVGLSYSAGPTVGLLKPYYLELKYFDEDNANELVVRTEKFSENNADVFLDVTRIVGGAPFSQGLGEISIRPGLHGKAAVHLDWGAFDEFVKAVEAGIMLDAFFGEVPIMVESKRVENSENRSIFFNLYLNLQLGKRW